MASVLPLTSTAPRSGANYVSPLQPLKRLIAERQFKILLVLFAFLGVASGLAGILIAIKMLRAPQLVYVLDAAGNYSIGPLESIKKESPMFTNIAGQATLLFFARGPGGLDNQELAQRIFSRACFEKVLEDVKAERPDMEAKDLRYKPEIREYDLSIPDDNGRRIVRVAGFYTVCGAVDGLALVDKREFKLTLALIPNPDFISRGMYPFVVSAFKKVVISN
jgi:hypothetical protein